MIKKNIFRKFFGKVSNFFDFLSCPTVSVDWLKNNDCSYSSESENGKWQYYWYGDFNNGYEVKVRYKGRWEK